jgi:hypothetical protein
MGELHCHDGRMALACRERQRRLLASFDRDSDRLSWLTRVAMPAEVGGATLPSPRATSQHRPTTSDTLHGLSHAPVDDTWPRMIVHTRQESYVNARGIPLSQ